MVAALALLQYPSTESVESTDGSRWLGKKYEALSNVVPLTNWWRFGDTTAGETMHAALWNVRAPLLLAHVHSHDH